VEKKFYFLKSFFFFPFKNFFILKKRGLQLVTKEKKVVKNNTSDSAKTIVWHYTLHEGILSYSKN